MRAFRSPALILAALVWAGLASVEAVAQTPGTTRAQGRVVGAPAPQAPASRAATIDYREQMRQFIQAISMFARRQRRDFFVVSQNGLALLAKADDADESRLLPARTYMRSIDGVLQEALFFGLPEVDRPTSEHRRKALLPLTELARTNGLKVLVLDHARTPATIDESYRLNSGVRSYIGLVQPGVGAAINTLPSYPARPAGENPDAVMSLGNVKNFAYLRDSAPFGREDQFALAMHDNNFDLVVVDVFHGRQALGKRAVETLKYKKLGTRRLVFAYVDIGRAQSDRYYWKPEWREGSPSWIGAPFPGEPDKFFVDYWRPEWQKIISGDTQSYVYGAIDQGFDGVVLDGVDSYSYFEGGIEAVEVYR